MVQSQEEIAFLWKQHRLGPRSTGRTPFLEVTFYQSIQNLSTISFVVNLISLCAFPGCLVCQAAAACHAMLPHGAGLTKLSNKGSCFGLFSQQKVGVKGMSPQITS